ncbi:MAG: hypothetical protein M3Q64_01235 [bacterium]|nr:hypothetical protein [bacterium]
MQEYLTEVTSVKALTLNVREVAVKIIAPEEIVFKPGQAMQVKIGVKTYESAIAIAPLEHLNHLIFCINIADHSPLADFAKAVVVGAQIRMHGPVNDFVADNIEKDMLCMAKDVGIAAFVSMIPILLINDFAYNIKLLFEVGSEEDMFYFDKFSSLGSKYPNFVFTPVVISPHAHWPGELGTISTYIQLYAEKYKDCAVYVAGNKEFVEYVSSHWKKRVLVNDRDIKKYVVGGEGVESIQ